MLYSGLSRELLLNFMPKGGEIVEVGTAEGDFAQEILNRVQPKTLHLIDPWAHQDRDDYAKDVNNVDQKSQDARFEAVQKRFAAQIASGQVVVHRAFSPEAAEAFTDESLDWVYIDGLHSEQAVAADLRAWKSKIKPEGILMGHDYAASDNARKMGFGVVEAVNAFVEETGYTFVALTGDTWPSYVLSAKPNGATADMISANLIHQVPGVIEIRDAEKRTFMQKMISFSDGSVRLLPSI